MTVCRRYGARRGRAGFTLIEMLVVIMLLAILAGMAWPLLRPDRPSKQLQRSAERLSAVLAMCQAKAMLDGHRYQLTWLEPESEENESDMWLPAVEHEADPIGAPGEFQPVQASWANEPVLLGPVQCPLVQLGPLDLVALEANGGFFELSDEASLPTVQFYPDGTADDAVFVLTVIETVDDELVELQRWIVLDGTNGLATIQEPLEEEDLAEQIELQAALLDLKFEEERVTTGVLLTGQGGEYLESDSGEEDELQELLEELLGGLR